MRRSTTIRTLGVLPLLGLVHAGGQATPAPAQNQPGSIQPAAGGVGSGTAPPSLRLTSTTAQTSAPVAVHMVNGEVYTRPTHHDIFRYYVRDTYGVPAGASTTIRALYAEGRGKPTGWGTDAAGFGQRFGSSAAVTVIDGNVRLAMELTFHEDLRYLPCNRCSAVHKIENALLSEITARHDSDGHRFFTLTPTIADFSGPIITHQLWYPGSSSGPLSGVISARTVFATRIGTHLFREFVISRFRHPSPPPGDNVPAPPKTP